MRWFVFLTFLLLPTLAWSGDFYVDNVGGDDLFDGRASVAGLGNTGPVRTIQQALRRAGRGDRIRLTNNPSEPYRECVYLHGQYNGGWYARGLTTQPNAKGRQVEEEFLSEPLSIEGNGAVLDGSFPVTPGAWEHHTGSVFRFRPPRTAYQQLFIDNRPVARALEPDDGSIADALRPREWCLFEGHIHFAVEPGRSVYDYNFRCAGHACGLTLYKIRGVVISDLVLQGYQLDGINARDGARDVALVNVISRGNGRSGVSVGGTSAVELDGCLLGDNGHCQLHAEEESRVTLRESKLLPKSAPAILRTGNSKVDEVGDGGN